MSRPARRSGRERSEPRNHYSRSTWRHRTVETALTAGALVGALCAAWALASVALGLTPLVLVSGSMSPAIEAGDLAVARAVPARDLAVGDVVSVETSGGVRVTHRVVALTPQADATSLVLQGDANATPDAAPYVVTTADRVLFHVPYAGRVVAAVSSRLGVVLLGVAVAGLLLLGFGGRPPSGPTNGRARHRDAAAAPGGRARRSVATGAMGIAAVAVAAGLVPPPTPTTAYLTDGGAATSGTLTTGRMSAPAISCANGSGGSTPTISWPVPQGPTPAGYLVSYNSTIYPVSGTSWQVPSALLTLGTYPVTVTSQRAPWSSASSNTVSVRMLSVLGITAASCA